MKNKQKDIYILYDMREDSVRMRKTKPDVTESPFDLVVPISLKFKIPEIKINALEAEIDVPKGEVKELVTDLVEREDEIEEE